MHYEKLIYWEVDLVGVDFVDLMVFLGNAREYITSCLHHFHLLHDYL